MGRTFQFECPHCRYQARVSGGADTGLNCSIQTVLCRDCRELFDVFIRIRKKVSSPEEPPRAKSNHRLLPAPMTIPPMMLVEQPWPEFQPGRSRQPAPPTSWEQLKPECPMSKVHRVQVWTDPGRCPRCGNFMEKNAFAWRRWD